VAAGQVGPSRVQEVPLSPEEPFGSDLLLGDRLGAGATGEVRRATVRSTGEQVAVKLLRPDLAGDPVLVARFLQEADVLRRLTHPNLVRLRDVVLEGGRLGLVVDLVDGGDLRGRLQAAGRLAPADAATTVAEVADALVAVHAAGVVHRDVKPANVLIDGDGRARLADLGVARLASAPELTRHSGVVGTPDYLAPRGVGR
jgi:serine/threonine-protein kinase